MPPGAPWQERPSRLAQARPSGFHLKALHALQVTDTTTFTAEERRAEVDAWLYETCTQCLQHMVDIVALFYKPVAPILPRIFDLLSNFIRYAVQAVQNGLDV